MAMPVLTSRALRRRLYFWASLVILGLEFIVYLVFLVLWRTRALEHHMFSLAHLTTVSLIISTTSQIASIASLAALTFLVQTLASDRTIRTREFQNVAGWALEYDLNYRSLQARRLRYYKIVLKHGKVLDRL